MLKSWIPTMTMRAPKIRRGRLPMGLTPMNQRTTRYARMTRPSPPIAVPAQPNRCSGRDRNRVLSITVMRSKNPFASREAPYFDVPKRRG